MVDDDAAPVPLPAPMWLPFALLGATAAFFCMLGLCLVLTDMRFAAPWSAAVSGGFAGALAGGLLRRWRSLHDPWLTPGKKLSRVALVVMSAGACVGASVTLCTVREGLLAFVQPLVVMACGVVGLLGLAVLERVEHRARRDLESVVDALSVLEPASATDVRGAGGRDLGLGEGGFSRVQLRDAYRGTRHGEVVLRGDPDEAREALRDAVARRRRALVFGLIAALVSSVAAFGYGDTHRHRILSELRGAR